MDLSQFAMFAGAAILVNLSPGPDMLFTFACSLKEGMKAGIVAALGIGAGGLVHAVLSAVGITAILASSPMAFDILRICGATYLMWLGIQAIRRANEPVTDTREVDGSYWSVFQKGFLTNVLNPKVGLFFLAFLPQFISPDAEMPALQILMLGIFFSLSGTVIIGSLGIFVGLSRQKIAASRVGHIWINRISGSVFILLGMRLLFLERN